MPTLSLRLSLFPLLIFSILWGCGGNGLVDDQYPGVTIADLPGQLSPAVSTTTPTSGDVTLGLVWQPYAPFLKSVSTTQAVTTPPVITPPPAGDWTALCAQGPGAGARDMGSVLWEGIDQPVVYTAQFPLNFKIAIRKPPPSAARVDLAQYGGSGTLSLAAVVAYVDANGNQQLDRGSPGTAGERILELSSSTPGNAASTYVVYLDGTLPQGWLPYPRGYSQMTVWMGKRAALLNPISTALNLTGTPPIFLDVAACTSVDYRYTTNQPAKPDAAITCGTSKRTYYYESKSINLCVMNTDYGAQCLADGAAVPADWPCK
jgi:hypothetical protein